MEPTLTTRHIGGTTIVALGGEIDAESAPRLLDMFADLAAADVRDMVVDMDAIESVDSTGLSALVRGCRKVRGCDGTKVVCTQSYQLKILRITHLDECLVINDSVDAALERV